MTNINDILKNAKKFVETKSIEELQRIINSNSQEIQSFDDRLRIFWIREAAKNELSRRRREENTKTEEDVLKEFNAQFK